jgi:hypothetical protein
MLPAHRMAGRSGTGIDGMERVHGERIGPEKPQACGECGGPGQGVNEHGLLSSRSPWPRPPHSAKSEVKAGNDVTHAWYVVTCCCESRQQTSVT